MKRLSDSEEQRSKQISFTVISHCRCRWCWFASRWLHSTHISQVSCVAFSHFADLYSFKFDMSVLTSVPNHSVQMLCMLERWPTRVTQICFFLFYHLYICADQLLQLAAHCQVDVTAARCAIPSTFGPSSPHFHSVWWRQQWDVLGCHGGMTMVMMCDSTNQVQVPANQALTRALGNNARHDNGNGNEVLTQRQWRQRWQCTTCRMTYLWPRKYLYTHEYE